METRMASYSGLVVSHPRALIKIPVETFYLPVSDFELYTRPPYIH